MERHTASVEFLVGVRQAGGELRRVGRVRRLRVRVEEALVALRHLRHVATLAAPVLEARQALGVGPLPRGGARVVVHVVHAPARVPPHLPARRQRLRPLPRRRPGVVIHIVSEFYHIYRQQLLTISRLDRSLLRKKIVANYTTLARRSSP